MLSGCDISNQQITTNPNLDEYETSSNINNNHNEKEDDNSDVNNNEEHNGNNNDDSGNNNKEDDDGENSENLDNENHGYIGENEENHLENADISLDDWKEYEFHNGHKPAYNSDWIFDYGGSINPRGCLWENPNEAVDYSGIEFSDKKQFLSSPTFNTYPKVEMRFQFWFSAHNKGKFTNGEPTFKIEEYSETEKLLNTDIIDIKRSDIPNNNTALEKRIYVTQSSMTHFKLRFNNRIANGSGDYTPILCKISLKGWPKA